MDIHLVTGIRSIKMALRRTGLVLLLILLLVTYYPTIEARADGCTYSSGYWKSHADLFKHYDTTWDLTGGPQVSFFNANLGWLQVLTGKPEGGNAYYILARQYIAAKLNFYSGADITIVSPSMDFTETLFTQPVFAGCSAESCMISTRVNSQYFDLSVKHAEILAKFNNGDIGSVQCDP
jgi:hypothetical protein